MIKELVVVFPHWTFIAQAWLNSARPVLLLHAKADMEKSRMFVTQARASCHYREEDSGNWQPVCLEVWFGIARPELH